MQLHRNQPVQHIVSLRHIPDNGSVSHRAGKLQCLIICTTHRTACDQILNQCFRSEFGVFFLGIEGISVSKGEGEEVVVVGEGEDQSWQRVLISAGNPRNRFRCKVSDHEIRETIVCP